MSLGDRDPAERARLVERLRRVGLRLDPQGRWWHEGAPVTHPRLARALYRWLDALPDGRLIVRLDGRRYAYVEAEGPPALIRSARVGDDGRVVLTLAGEGEEELDYASLAVEPDGALRARIKHGRIEARFSTAAQQGVADRIVPRPGGGFALRAAGRLWPIAGG